MGKGDRKTKRGKIWRGSFGKTRLTHEHDKPKTAAAKPAATPPVVETTVVETTVAETTGA